MVGTVAAQVLAVVGLGGVVGCFSPVPVGAWGVCVVLYFVAWPPPANCGDMGHDPGEPTPYIVPGLFTFGEAANGEGTFTEEGAWGEVRGIMDDAVRFPALGIDCGDVNCVSMTGVSVSMVMGEGGASSSAEEACLEVIPPTLATSST